MMLNIIYLADAAILWLAYSCLPGMLPCSGIVIDTSHFLCLIAHPPCMFFLHAIITLADGELCLGIFSI